MLSTILSWALFGLIAGAIAKLLHRGEDPGGWIITIIIGILGSVVGGFLFKTLLGPDWALPWSLKGFISAIVGAIILLVLYRMFTTKRG